MLKRYLVPAIAIAAFLCSAVTASASSNLSGWAWSSNVGWISFNSSDGGAGGGPYAVTVSTTTGSNVGSLSGYAWSPNIGWISFNPSDLSGCPAGTCAPTIDLSGGGVSGWARALAAVGRTDGWDGWIELAGTNHPTVAGLSGTATSSAGVSYNPSSGALSGYAWGSNVVGWLSFAATSGAGSVTVCQNGSCIATTTSSSLAVYCTASPNPATLSNGSATVNMTSTVSNGTGPYTYSWTDGSSHSTDSATYSTPGLDTLPNVTVTDTSNGKTGTGICGTATVQNPAQIPNNGSDSLWLNGNQTLTNIHIRSGQSVTVDYAWPTGSVCTPVMAGPTALLAWTSLSNLLSGGNSQLVGLSNGIYDLQLSCMLNSNQSTSNSVEIDVTPSVVQEL